MVLSLIGTAMRLLEGTMVSCCVLRPRLQDLIDALKYFTFPPLKRFDVKICDIPSDYLRTPAKDYVKGG